MFTRHCGRESVCLLLVFHLLSKGFVVYSLTPQDGPRGVVKHSDLISFLSEASEFAVDKRNQKREEQFAAMTVALPKNVDGRLDQAAARYALHRYFLEAKGWRLYGLEPNAPRLREALVASTNAIGALPLVEAPLYTLALIDDLLGGSGLSVRQLAISSLALEQLYANETARQLADLYASKYLPLSADISAAEVKSLLLSYFTSMLPDGHGFKSTQIEEFLDSELRNVVDTQVLSHQVVTRFASTLGSAFARSTSNCSLFSGRGGFKSDQVLALDSGGATCTGTHRLFCIGCVDECSNLFSRVELASGGAETDPGLVASTFEALSTSTLRGQRQLAPDMRTQLDRMAAAEASKKIRLHGRPFAHWMHLAFPQVCAKPGSNATGPPATFLDEWSLPRLCGQKGVDGLASESSELVGDAAALDNSTTFTDRLAISKKWVEEVALREAEEDALYRRKVMTVADTDDKTTRTSTRVRSIFRAVAMTAAVVSALVGLARTTIVALGEFRKTSFEVDDPLVRCLF